MTVTTDDPHDVPQPEAKGSLMRERQITLEERINKLEIALAEQNAPALTEDAVAARVIAKMSTLPGMSQTLGESDRVLVLASSNDERPPPPKGAVLHPPEATTDPVHRTWFVTQFLAELRLAVHMYFDPRYRISRTTQFALPGIALLFLFNYFFFAIWVYLAFLSPIAERAIDVLLCVIGYKLLIRELDRYRDVLNYLTRYGHR
jgi:hypothetical protein